MNLTAAFEFDRFRRKSWPLGFYAFVNEGLIYRGDSKTLLSLGVEDIKAYDYVAFEESNPDEIDHGQTFVCGGKNHIKLDSQTYELVAKEITSSMTCFTETQPDWQLK